MAKSLDLIIENGTITTPLYSVDACIGISGGKVVAIAKRSHMPPSDTTVDAGGNLVLPGMVDMHTHFRDPGYTAREDFEHGTMAAAAGGVTTIMDMPNNLPPITSVENFLHKKQIVEKKAYVDFALCGAVGNGSIQNTVPLAKAGVAAFKTLMIRQEIEGQAVDSDSSLIEVFSEVSKTGKPCLIHAENENLVDAATKALQESQRFDAMSFIESRPAVSEIEAISRAIILARETAVHLHVVHVSSGDAIEYIRNGKKKGQRLTAEVTPHYLLLTADAMKTLGPYAKIQPPLRKTGHEQLWKGLLDGTIDAIASDHAPYTEEEKEKGRDNIFEGRSGMPGVETTLTLMLTCVNKGQITLSRLIEVFSINPSKILGVYPRKGTIQIGSDADLTIVDMHKAGKIEGAKLHSKQKVSMFEGAKTQGAPIVTIVRGNVVMKDGEILGKPGTGQLVP